TALVPLGATEHRHLDADVFADRAIAGAPRRRFERLAIRGRMRLLPVPEFLVCAERAEGVVEADLIPVVTAQCLQRLLLELAGESLVDLAGTDPGTELRVAFDLRNPQRHERLVEDVVIVARVLERLPERRRGVEAGDTARGEVGE